MSLRTTRRQQQDGQIEGNNEEGNSPYLDSTEYYDELHRRTTTRQEQGNGGESYLDSAKYYDELRRNIASSNITREEGNNVDILSLENGEEIALCHISVILPFTHRDYVPVEGYFEEATSIALAIQHLNTGDGSLAPKVEGLNERCNIRFTTEFADTEFEAGVALDHVVDQTRRDPTGPEPLPCAYVGAYRSAISMPTSLITGIMGYPQVSPGSTSADLDDKSQFPLFGRTVPSDQGNAIPMIIYLSEVLKIKHLAIINVNDAYGNAYVDGLRAAARTYAPDMIINQNPLDDESAIEVAVADIKRSGYRFIFSVVFTQTTHDALLTEAYKQGIAGDGKHNWLFGDSFQGILAGRRFDKNSPLHLAYQGVGIFEVSGGISGVPAYDRYTAQLAALKNPADMEYLGNLFPKHDHPNYGSNPPFVDDENFLAGPLKSGYAPFSYEAAIALGLAACDTITNSKILNGPKHYDTMKDSPFDGISGEVLLDPISGTRNPSSTLYKVANFVSEEVEDWTGTTRIQFKSTNTDMFLKGKWENVEPYIFNDGTSNLPVDLPPPELEDGQDMNLTFAIGLPVLILFISGVVIFLFYENKRKENDLVWQVKKEDLKFNDPPDIIGRGTFGLVLRGEYRGTDVAVKRVLPPAGAKRASSGGGGGGRSDSSFHSSMDMTSKSLSSENGPPEESNAGMKSGVSVASGMTGVMSVVGGGKNMAPSRKSSIAVHKKLKQEFIEEMRYLSKLRHPCVTTVMGAVISKTSEPMLIMEYMHHGSLYDILHNETMAIEGELLLPILRDISQGVRFLHSADPQVIHGDLKAQNILVDNKFRAKVADFGLSQKKNLGGTGTPFWMAPELLRGESLNTAATDVYSFGIILYEVYSRRDPYEAENPEEVLEQVADRHIQKRPPTPLTMPTHIKSLMTDCVDGDPGKRPTFEEIDIRLKRVDAEKIDPKHVARKDAQISLFDIFPRHIAEALRDGRSVEPEHKDVVTIFFSDIVGFTNISSELEPRKVATMLDRLYTKFDNLSQKHDIFKVETIGDAYMAVTNLVKNQENDHAKRIAEFAIEAVEAAKSTYIDEDDESKGFVNIRVGFHSGSVVADVVGTRNPRYCLFGDTVNTASRMESNSKVNRIHCSSPAANWLRDQCPEIPLKSRGSIPIKGKGKMYTFWVNERGNRTYKPSKGTFAADNSEREGPPREMYSSGQGDGWPKEASGKNIYSSESKQREESVNLIHGWPEPSDAFSGRSNPRQSLEAKTPH